MVVMAILVCKVDYIQNLLKPKWLGTPERLLFFVLFCFGLVFLVQGFSA